MLSKKNELFLTYMMCYIQQQKEFRYRKITSTYQYFSHFKSVFLYKRHLFNL